MLQDYERKRIIEYILNQAKIKEIKPVSDMYGSTYKLTFRYCSVEITEFTLKSVNGLAARVDIVENFTDRNFAYDIIRSRHKKDFFGFQRIYSGSINGLEEIALRGIDKGHKLGSLVSSGEIQIATRDSKSGRDLTKKDKYRFDDLLTYVQEELSKPNLGRATN